VNDWTPTTPQGNWNGTPRRSEPYDDPQRTVHPRQSGPQGQQQAGWNAPTQKLGPTITPANALTQKIELPGSQTPDAKPRSTWADVAKGVCILLVVLWHVIMKHYLQIDWHLPVPIPGAWGTLGDQLLPLRMPVFFTISGMFAANAALRPWRVVLRSRVAKFYYIYVLWFIVHTTILSLVVPGFDTLSAHSVWDILAQLSITPTNLWYMIALAVYFVIAKVTIKVPAAALLIPALLLNGIASAGWLAAPGNRGQLYQNLLFFLIGLRLKPYVEKWARIATLKLFLVGAAGYLVFMLAMQVLGAKEWFGVWPVISLLAVVLGVAGAVQLERWKPVSTKLAQLGRNTLPIYVMHMPILALIHAALLDTFSGAGTGIQLILAVFLPVALTAFLAAVCLTLHKWLIAAGANWLFDLPQRRRRSLAIR
jgi:uncharacterized membrane protein YcfT